MKRQKSDDLPREIDSLPIETLRHLYCKYISPSIRYSNLTKPELIESLNKCGIFYY